MPPHPAAVIPHRLLIAAGPFDGLAPEQVAAPIVRGLRSGGAEEPDVLTLDPGVPVLELLDAGGFDRRMRAARAVVVALARLDETTLTSTPAFEIATRARQGGVPAYAITAANGLGAFDARILDLQLILQARDPRALAAAGRRLAAVA